MFSRLGGGGGLDLWNLIELEPSSSACWSSAQYEHRYARFRPHDIYAAQGTSGNLLVTRLLNHSFSALNNTVGEYGIDEPSQAFTKCSLTNWKQDEYDKSRIMADPIALIGTSSILLQYTEQDHEVIAPGCEPVATIACPVMPMAVVAGGEARIAGPLPPFGCPAADGLARPIRRFNVVFRMLFLCTPF